MPNPPSNKLNSDANLNTNSDPQNATQTPPPCSKSNFESSHALVTQIKQWGQALGFADIGITDTDLSSYETEYFNWLGENYHGDMDYMARHGTKRTRPNELEPGTQSIISVRLNYLDLSSDSAIVQLHQPQQAYISRYALGKDYHKLLRKRLQALAEKIAQEVPNFHYRAFTDSAPVLERPIAEKSGLGFTGKNSLIIHPRAGSWFFLGELYTNLKLPIDPPFTKQGCGPCTACIKECPTQAIIDNAVVDARRCISYLTIEYKGSIDEALRPLIGNRIYGCDDCQLVCPWNKFTENAKESAFSVNHNQLDNQSLLSLWQWTEVEFLKKLEGSPIRRIGYAQWTRNLAIALGNIKGNSESDASEGKTIEDASITEVIEALESKLNLINELVDEHIHWAIKQQQTILNRGGSVERSIDFCSDNSVIEPPINLTYQTIKPFKAPKYYLPSLKESLNRINRNPRNRA
ncbi:MAG: epoxyqueuosine reductase [Thiomicrorhabdus sp.]|nr:MAG: epoxyqueuosine reductase [Thiomicrorhabdus sp.]